MTGKRIAGITSVALATALLLAGVAPAGATSNKGWQVGPGSFGIMYGNTDADTISGVRAWEAATWCRIQPSPDADMRAILETTLGPQLDAQRASGATSAVVGLGHPPAWVFNNSARATRNVVQYGCSSNAAAGVSIPAHATLKRTKNGTLPLQARRWDTYVRAVIDFIDARYGDSMAIMLQVWNEPNLSSGLSVKNKVRGASRTVEDAVASLYELERITRAAVRSAGNPAITLTSTALHHRPNKFARLYLAKQGRKPVVQSLAFNVYADRTRTPNAMVKQWNQRVADLRARTRKYKKLRKLPALIGETNLNLVNNRHDKSNLSRSVTNADTQRRLAAGVQMDAFYHGFRSVYWLRGPQVQAAVHIGHNTGTPARAALTVLRGQLQGMVITGCRTNKGVRRCGFRDPSGARQSLTVYWRLSKTSRIRLTGPSTIVQMTGETAQVGPGKVTVGTTPIVVVPA